MHDVRRLSVMALADIVGRIVDLLFLDLNPPDCPAALRDCDVYNPDKDWAVDDLDSIAQLLHATHLAPSHLGDQPRSIDDIRCELAVPQEDGGCLGRALALPASATEKGEQMSKDRGRPPQPRSSSIERVQTGVRLNKPLVKVLKAVAELFDMSLGTLIELIVLESLAGRAPFGGPTLARIRPFLEIYGLRVSDEPDPTSAHLGPLASDGIIDEP